MNRDDLHFYSNAMLDGLIRVGEVSERLTECSQDWSPAGHVAPKLLRYLEDYISACGRVIRFVSTQQGSQVKAERARARSRAISLALTLQDIDLSEIMRLRNRIEHMDEDFDDMVRKQDGETAWGTVVASSSDAAQTFTFSRIQGVAGKPLHVFQSFYTDVGAFQVVGQSYSIYDLAIEIAAVGSRVVTFLNDFPGFESSERGVQGEQILKSLQRFSADFPLLAHSRFATDGCIVLR